MPPSLQCYNRGCGQKFDDEDNEGENCLYHPGAPFFHDAYKGWTCCQRKSTDFTEFLNFPGCTKGKHSNVKPEEPASITGDKTKVDDDGQRQRQEERTQTAQTAQNRVPIATPLPRPSLEVATIRIQPKVAASFKASLERSPLVALDLSQRAGDDKVIQEGEPCKNGGCTKVHTNCMA